MPSPNPIRAKMESYGDRLRDLISEAFQEGIVLLAPEPREDGTELPPVEGQQLMTIYAPVLHRGHMHLNLKMTPRIMVRCVVKNNASGEAIEIVPSVKIPLPKQAS